MFARRLVSTLILATGLLSSAASAQAPYHSPIAVAADHITGDLFIAQKDARQILQYDTSLDSVLGNNLPTLPFPDDLSGVALSPDRETIYATTSGSEGVLFVIDRDQQTFVASIPVGHYPSDPEASSIASEVFVINQFANKISVVDVDSDSVVAEIDTEYQPYCMALTPDSTRLIVGHLIPNMPADGPAVYPNIAIYDTQTRALLHTLPMYDGSSGVRDVCISPDGQYAYLTHCVGRYRLPTTHIERGWIWTNAVTVVDLEADPPVVVNTVLVDDNDLGAANPWPVSCTEDGAWLCVACAGSEELMVIDRAAMHSRLDLVAGGQPYEEQGWCDSAAEVPYDLGFLNSIRQRIALTGKGARSLAVVDGSAFVLEYFSDVIDVVPDIGPSAGDAYAVPLSEFGTTDPMAFIEPIELPAEEAALPASGIVLESQYTPPNLGGWNDLAAEPSWNFSVPKDGNYMISIVSSAPSSQGGSYEIVVDGEPYHHGSYDVHPDAYEFYADKRTVVPTDDWRVYEEHLAAEGVILSAGSHTLSIRPLTMNGSFLMNLQKVVITTSVTDLERVGEILFNDGTTCFQQWLSCASCHPDGRVDGLNWDLGNDGLGGSPRNVKSLLLAHQTPPTTMTGVRPHAFASVRAGFKFIEFSVVSEEYNVATDAYLIGMEPLPSPYLENGALSAAAQRGETLFASRCAGCHDSSTHYTSSAFTGNMYNVTGESMDSPTLIEAWRTAPYLGSGGAVTVREAIEALSVSGGLSSAQLDDLSAYVLSIGPTSDQSSAYLAWQWVENSRVLLPDETDLDGDGMNQLFEYFHGTDPNQRDPMAVPRLVRSGDQFRWQYRGRAVTDIDAVLYHSPDCSQWQPLQTLPNGPCELFDIPVPMTGESGFFRLELSRRGGPAEQ